MRMLFKWFGRLVVLIFVSPVLAGPSSADNTGVPMQNVGSEVESLIASQVMERYSFYGLASYYNAVNYYRVDSGQLQSIDPDEEIEMTRDLWIVVAGRFNVLLIKGDGVTARLDAGGLEFSPVSSKDSSVDLVKVLLKPDLASTAPELDQVRYAHLWAGLSWFARVVEAMLVFIQGNFVGSWGLAIIVFAVVIKICLLPISLMVARSQRRVSQLQAILLPQIEKIKAEYDGEDAHNRLMDAHRALGVSPFFTLGPLVLSLIQVPVLIAIFNALGEMPQLDGESFLWIENLAYPDAVTTLPFTVPMLGGAVNVLPFLMTALTVLSTLVYRDRHAPVSEIKRQKRNLYLMAGAFFVLFYPFPAAMVLFWIMANILQIIERKLSDG